MTEPCGATLSTVSGIFSPRPCNVQPDAHVTQQANLLSAIKTPEGEEWQSSVEEERSGCRHRDFSGVGTMAEGGVCIAWTALD